MPERRDLPTAASESIGNGVRIAAQLLLIQLTELEDACERAKAKREEKKDRATSLNKSLAALKAQEQREKDSSSRLSILWAEKCGIDASRPGILSAVTVYGPQSCMTEDLPQSIRFYDKLSATLGPSYISDSHQERYRDSHAFSRSAESRCRTEPLEADGFPSACFEDLQPIVVISAPVSTSSNDRLSTQDGSSGLSPVISSGSPTKSQLSIESVYSQDEQEVPVDTSKLDLNGSSHSRKRELDLNLDVDSYGSTNGRKKMKRTLSDLGSLITFSRSSAGGKEDSRRDKGFWRKHGRAHRPAKKGQSY